MAAMSISAKEKKKLPVSVGKQNIALLLATNNLIALRISYQNRMFNIAGHVVAGRSDISWLNQ